MSAELLAKITQEASALSAQEQLELAAHLIEQARLAIDDRTPIRKQDQGPLPTRYRLILDVLLNSPRSYDLVVFDHANELPNPYRGRARLGTSALQVEPGKGRSLHKKQADITAMTGDVCDIIIEEELRPNKEKIDDDIAKISPCKYLWTLGQQFELHDPCLFVLVNDDKFSIRPYTIERVGNLRRVIVCRVEEFQDQYENYYLQNM